MESEEAIMENENNSNLESESNIRDRDQHHHTSEGFGHNVAPYLTEPRDIASPGAFWGERDLSTPSQSLNIDSIVASSSSSATPKELTFEQNGEHCDVNFEIEESTEITFSSESASTAREKDIPADNEDFIGSAHNSPNKINIQATDSENVVLELATDEAQEYKDFSNSRSEEEMEVDSSRLDPAEGLAAGSIEHTNVDQQTGDKDIVEPVFCSQQSVNQEMRLINNREISEEPSNPSEVDQSGPALSRSINVIPSSAKNWDDDVDLLSEDSMDSISHKDNVVKEETSIPVLSGEKSAFKDVCEEFDESQEVANDDIVTERPLEPLAVTEGPLDPLAPHVEITKQSTPESVPANSPLEAASLVLAHLKDSELLNDQESDLEETSQSSPSQPIPSPNDIYSENDRKDGDKSVACVEENVDVTFDKTSSETYVTYRLDTESLRDTGSHVTEGLIDIDSHVTEDLGVTDSHVTEGLRDTDSHVTEGLGFTDSHVTEGLRDTVRDIASHVTEGLRETDSHVTEGLRETDSHVTDDLRETDSHVTEGLRDTDSNVTEGLRETDSHVTEGLRETDSHVTEGLRDTDSNVTDDLRDTDSHVTDDLRDTVRDTDSHSTDDLRDTDSHVTDDLRDTDSHVTDGLKNTVRDTDSHVNEGLRDTVRDTVRDTDSHVTEDLRDTDSHVTDDLRDTDSHVNEGLRDTVRDTVRDTDSHVTDDLRDTDSHVTDDLRDTDSHVTDDLRDTDSHVTDDLRDTDSHLTEGLRDTDSHVTEGLRDTESHITENLGVTDGNVTDDLKDTDSNVTEGLRDTDSHVTEGLRDTDSNVTDDLRDTDSHVTDDLRDTDSHVTEGLRDTDSHVTEGLRDTDSHVTDDLRDTDSHVTDDLRDTDSNVTEGLRDTDSHVTEGLRDTDSHVTEDLGVTDGNVTEDVSNDNQSSDILSLQDDKLEVDDVIQACEIDQKPVISSRGVNIHLTKSRQSSHEIRSESCGFPEANGTSVDAASEVVELGDVTNNSYLSADSPMVEHLNKLDALTDEAAQSECNDFKEDTGKNSTCVASDVIAELDHTSSGHPKLLNIVAEGGHGTLEEHVLEDTTTMVGEDANLPDYTATSEHPKQFGAVDEDISNGDVLEDTTTMGGDDANSPEHPTQFGAGGQNNNNIGDEGVVENTSLMLDDSGNIPELTPSSEHQKQLENTAQDNTISDKDIEETRKFEGDSGNISDDTTSSDHSEHLGAVAQDKNYTSDEDVLEDSTNIEDDSVNNPDLTTLSEHSKQVDSVIDNTIDHSENSVMEDTIEMPLDIHSSNNSTESGEADSSKHQKDTPLDTCVQKDSTTGEEIVDVLVEPPPLRPEDEAMKVDEISCGIVDHPENENSSIVLVDDDELTHSVSGSMEVAGESSITPKTNESIVPKEKSCESPAETCALQRMEITAEKGSKRKKRNVRNDASERGSASTFSPPAKNISTESQDDVMEISLEPETVATNVNQRKEDSVIQLKTELASSERAKQNPGRATRSNCVKEKTVEEDSDDDVKIVSVKNEALGSKVAENGLDKISVSGQQYHLQKNTDKSPVAASSKDTKKTESSKSKSSKSKVQTCLVCQKICKCKYNIVRNGDVKHLCDDACFKQFRKTPSVFLKSNDNVKPSRKSSKSAQSATTGKDSLALYQQAMKSKENSNYKTCAVCQLLNLNTSEPFCNWKGLDFCGESCLGKFQANLNTSCSFCHAYIPIDMRATCCIKIGNDMRPFCKQRCYNEFKKKLRLCSFCQRDVAGVSGAFTAMVGTEGKFKEFCSQTCMKQLENEITDLEILCVEKGSLKPETITCCICRKRGSLKYTVQFQGKGNKLCSDVCLAAFKYTNKINLDTCDNCRNTCTAEEVQAHFTHYEGQMKHFCSDFCVSLFRKANSKVVQCGWCATKKLNFDMIEKQDVENVVQVFCSLNCLSLHRVNLQAKSGQVVSCDQCRKAEPAQYHLTMSDASVRNFCSYSCVMTFQSHFASKYTSGSGQPAVVVPAPQLQPQLPEPLVQHQPQVPVSRAGRAGRGRMNTRQASARQQSPTFPVISSVVSLAVPQAGDQQPQALPNKQPPPQAPPQVPAQQPGTTLAAAATAGNMLPSADGKHQILIQAAPPKTGKNKSSQCRPVTQTKSTLCKPHTQSRDTQTDEIAPKCVMIPIPVPIYIPMPTVMYSAPTPKLVPFPIPIPVPIFIPTTRKSANGISKAIQEIVERMPSDPLEAELLMMAEAVAGDKRPGDSDTDSEADETGADDFGVSVENEVIKPVPREDESLMMRKREGQGEEDMIQMALRMAEEMSGPIEDLETSVEPVAVSSEAPPNQQQHQSIQYENQVDDEYVPPRPSQRGAKRPGQSQSSRVKRQRVERSYNDDDSIQSDHSTQLQSMGPPPDVNYRLKFTYGVNAWRHWIVSKNAQIEKTKQMTGSYRLRPYSTDILKCTTEELNFTLCMFIKEVRKPNGDEYSPDSIYYLCLGIQQYLYENSRIDNIFTDTYFDKFTNSLNEVLKTLQPKVNSQGQMLCRIEEEHLWESKQLGAHSPFILLNTLIYFHTKHFILKSAQEHLSLSFAQILKHWKKGMPLKGHSASSGKNVSLRFYCLANGKKDGLAARKNKDGVPSYEVTENFDNPLHCPVKLYEFFLSKCPESIKNRNDIFYPVPERSCVPDSPVWYSTQSIDVHTMDKMLTRVLMVREIQEAHLHAQPVYM